MIKTRNQLEAVQQIAYTYTAQDHNPVTIERIAFALKGNKVVAINTSGLTLVAEFTDKAIKRAMRNPRDCVCYLVALADGEVGYSEAAGLIIQINAPKEADGTGRPVFYGALIEHGRSGIVQLYQPIKHPKRKAKKVPALGYQNGVVAIKSKAPKKEHRTRAVYADDLEENTGSL